MDDEYRDILQDFEHLIQKLHDNADWATLNDVGRIKQKLQEIIDGKSESEIL